MYGHEHSGQLLARSNFSVLCEMCLRQVEVGGRVSCRPGAPRPLARPPRLIAAITETVDTGPRQLPTGWVVPISQTAEDSSTRDTKRYH